MIQKLPEVSEWGSGVQGKMACSGSAVVGVGEGATLAQFWDMEGEAGSARGGRWHGRVGSIQADRGRLGSTVGPI